MGSTEGNFVLRQEILYNDTEVTGDGCKSKDFGGEGEWDPSGGRRGQSPHEQGQFYHCHRRESSKDGTGPDSLGIWRWEYEGVSCVMRSVFP